MKLLLCIGLFECDCKINIKWANKNYAHVHKFSTKLWYFAIFSNTNKIVSKPVDSIHHTFNFGIINSIDRFWRNVSQTNNDNINKQQCPAIKFVSYWLVVFFFCKCILLAFSLFFLKINNNKEQKFKSCKKFAYFGFGRSDANK